VRQEFAQFKLALSVNMDFAFSAHELGKYLEAGAPHGTPLLFSSAE